MRTTITFVLLFIFSFGLGDGQVVHPAYQLRKDITTTMFFVGEKPSKNNHWISNEKSAWDVDWVKHFGCVDDPNKRAGWLPAKCKGGPKENPWYVALPFQDFEPSGRKKVVTDGLVPWMKGRTWGNLESVMKNQWVRIISPVAGVVAYGQVEDAGPFEYDDWEYVFRGASPKTKENGGVGLDVSPAINDYLKLGGKGKLHWQFVLESEVPDGPWKLIVTTSQINW